MRRAAALLPATLLTVLALGAAPPPSGASFGALTRIAGPGGCLAAAARPGCAVARGLAGARRLALSPDGRSIYVTAARGDGVAVFARDLRTGRLTQLPGVPGCFSAADPQLGCTTDGLPVFAGEVAISPDGRNAYVARENGVLAFVRDPGDGSLRAAGCVAVASRQAGCAPANGLEGAQALAVSPDGRNVYVAAPNRNSLVTLRRDPGDGRLEQPAGPAGCFAFLGGDRSGTCTEVPTLDGAKSVGVTPDGGEVYVAASRENSYSDGSLAVQGGVTFFRRDPSSGALADAYAVATDQRCLDPDYVLFKCKGAGPSLLGAMAAATSPDGNTLYVAGDALTVLRRGADGRLRDAGCLGPGVKCRRAAAAGGVERLIVSPDGHSLYTARRGIAVWRRDVGPTREASLQLRPGPRGVGGVGDLALTPDGRDLYAVEPTTGTLVGFHRSRAAELRVAPMRIRLRANATGQLVLWCAARPGARCRARLRLSAPGIGRIGPTRLVIVSDRGPTVLELPRLGRRARARLRRLRGRLRVTVRDGRRRIATVTLVART